MSTSTVLVYGFSKNTFLLLVSSKLVSKEYTNGTGLFDCWKAIGTSNLSNICLHNKITILTTVWPNLGQRPIDCIIVKVCVNEQNLVRIMYRMRCLPRVYCRSKTN